MLFENILYLAIHFKNRFEDPEIRNLNFALMTHTDCYVARFYASPERVIKEQQLNYHTEKPSNNFVLLLD